MRFFLSVLVVGLLAIPAHAQWYARGEFNGFGLDHPMVDSGDGIYFTRTVTDLFPDWDYEFKIANEDFSLSVPGNNAKARTTDLGFIGELHLHFWDITEWDDGWFPNNQRRVGYDDPEAFGWEIVGTFNDWDGGEPWHLTGLGNGLYTGQFPFDAGIHEFKFRQQGSWDISIGNGDLSNSGSNNVFAVLSDGDLWNFELDLPNGRWRAFTEAEPPGQPGDFNGDGIVDAADYVMWRKHDGTQGGFDEWRANFGAGVGPEPWYVRGDFNDFGLDHQMVDLGDGHFTATVTGLNPGEGYEYKVARANWSEFEPVNNGITFADANGEITFHFFDDIDPNDGWQPNKRRVGYEDHGQFGWELMGEMNGWGGGPEWYLTDMGDGLHRLEAQLFAGNYQLKFRKQDDWDVNIGADFGNHAPNGFVTLSEDGLWAFELDLPGGRWRAALVSGSGLALAAVPEPASFLLAIFGAMALGGIRRRNPRASGTGC